MTLPSSNNPISLGQIQTEFGGSNPIALAGEYYRNGSYTTSNNTNVPTSGTISLSNFYGSRRAIYGCTDSSATNYNRNATDDDGSCSYPSSGGGGDSGGGGSTTTYSIIPVYRYRNGSFTNGYSPYDHFCTTSQGNPAPDGYINEGAFCYIFSTQAPGTSAVVDDDDGDSANNGGKPYSGIMGYAYVDGTTNGSNRPTNNSNVQRIYARVNRSYGETLWTADPNEGSDVGYAETRTEFWAPTSNLTI
jgi:hypothetical protein